MSLHRTGKNSNQATKLDIFGEFSELFVAFLSYIGKNFLLLQKRSKRIAKTNVWQDEYWLPVLQLYLQRPVGVKPLYQRNAVQLCMELHVAPKTLHERQSQIAQLSTPRLERIWQTYSENPRRLARAVRLWREMRGFGAASEFYEGVEVQETF